MSLNSAQSFAALRHPGFRRFFFGNATAMLADNMEHVISYWVMFNKFHSPALSGFAVISHWLPFLLFSVYVGGLSERFDPRRMIQLGMMLFISVSLGWGYLFYTDTLQVWHAMLLLTIHGIAGVFWSGPAQLFVHDMVERDILQSAVRSNATSRYIGTMLGPAVGSVLLLVMQPAYAMFLNALIYLPLTLWLWKAPYGPKFRKAGAAVVAPAIRGLRDITATLRNVGNDPVMLSMMLVAGGASFFIGTAYQAQMPGFATSLGHADPGVAYSMLLGADAAGALFAGFLFESRGVLQASPRITLMLAAGWCLALASFAATSLYVLAVPLLFAAGFFELSFGAMAQTIVQLRAPAEMRGRFIGVFVMSSLGMRTFSGVTVGLLGDVIGIHYSLGFSALALLLLVMVLVWYERRAPKR